MSGSQVGPKDQAVQALVGYAVCPDALQGIVSD
jgi:hypothetical protein